MDFRNLRYFVAVAEELHFHRAAERLHVAQPAVSEQVRKLEEDLGVRLLERTARRVTLTPAGEAFVVEARRVLHQAAQARQAALGARDQSSGRLHVGHLPDAVPPSLPRVLARFAGATPGVEVVLQTGPAQELIERVGDRRLDAAVVCLPAAVADLRVTPFGEERVIVALNVSHPAAGGPSIGPAELGRLPLLVMARTMNPAFFDGLITAWRTAGVAAPLVEVSEPSPEHVLLAVAAGAGAALLPESVRQRYAVAGVQFLALDSSPCCPVALVSHAEPASLATTSLLQLARVEFPPARTVEPVTAAS
ncbi:MAG TPA: LysR substrate-binding domain-containing protein [Acidimicrobiia bacterium]